MSLKDRADEAYSLELQRREQRGQESLARGLQDLDGYVNRWRAALGSTDRPSLSFASQINNFIRDDFVAWAVDFDFVLEHLRFSGYSTFGNGKTVTSIWLADDPDKTQVKDLFDLGEALMRVRS